MDVLTQLEASAGLEEKWEGEIIRWDTSLTHLGKEGDGVGRRGVGCYMSSDDGVISKGVRRRNVDKESSDIGQAFRGWCGSTP